MQIVILASGRGKRINHNLPKSLIDIGNTCLFDQNKKFYKNFKHKILTVGYKKEKFLSKIDKSYILVENKKFKSTNMVESFFLAHEKLKKNCDILILYADILIDRKKIKIDKINTKKSLIFMNKNWLSLWKRRMNKKEIFIDAENVIIKKNKILEIGGKIEKFLPKFQFMGMILLKYKDYKNLLKFYIGIKNNKIDFTTFLNLAIQKKKIDFFAKIFNCKWMELDNPKDIKILKKMI